MRNFLFILVLLFAVPAHAADKVLDIQEVTSPGGIKAWLVEDHNIPVIAMSFGFRGAGAVLDPADKQGLSRLLSNTMDEGAGDLDLQAFQKDLSNLSIGLSFTSDRDDFGGSLKTLSENKARAFELLKLAVSSPRFDEEPVERMRAANLSRVRSSLSDPDWIAARFMNDMAFQGHIYAQNSGGTLTSLTKIMPADLKNFHDQYLGKNNVMVAVAGDISKQELAGVLDSIFGGLPKVTLPQKPADTFVQNEGKIVVFKKDIPQTIIEMMQPGIDKLDPDYQNAQIMNFILGSSGFGSRLTEEIREKRGLTYGIYSYFLNMRHFNGLQVSTSTENANTVEMISLIKAEWDKMKIAPISEQELEQAKTYLIGSLPLSLTSTDDIAGLLLTLQIEDMPIDYLEKRKELIQKATTEDIQRIAKRLLDTSKMTTVLVGQPGEIKDAVVKEIIPNAQ